MKKIEIINQPQQVNATVHEHRAPTDHSIALFKEIKEKAESNILEAVHVKDNLVQGAVVYYIFDPACDYHRFAFKFLLNGIEITGEEKIERDELEVFIDRRQHALKVLTRHIAQKITLMLMEQMANIINTGPF